MRRDKKLFTNKYKNILITKANSMYMDVFIINFNWSDCFFLVEIFAGKTNSIYCAK